MVSLLSRVSPIMCGALLLVIVASSCGSRGRVELLVFAAVSLTDALTEISREFEAAGDAEISLSFGGSQALAQQIARGAPADVFVSAGRFPVDLLAGRDLIAPATIELLSNTLVAVIRSDGVHLESMEQLRSGAIERVAVADPDLSPAGRYAQESLVSLGLWDDLQSKLIIGSDVRTALTYVKVGSADVAIVYATDAATVTGVRVLDIVPPGSHSTIVYPVAIARESENDAVAADFLVFLQSKTASAVFQKYGFEPPGP